MITDPLPIRIIRLPRQRPQSRTWPINDPDAKLSWRRLRIPTNKEGSTKRQLARGPVETAAAVEIVAVAFGNFFLMIPTGCLKKPTQKTRLFHSYAQARRRLINNRRKGNGREHAMKMRFLFDRSHPLRK